MTCSSGFRSHGTSRKNVRPVIGSVTLPGFPSSSRAHSGPQCAGGGVRAAEPATVVALSERTRCGDTGTGDDQSERAPHEHTPHGDLLLT